MRTKWEAARDRRANLENAEKNNIVADSTDVRIALMAKVHSGECTLEEVQTELKAIKRNAKSRGKLTRNQAYIRG